MLVTINNQRLLERIEATPISIVEDITRPQVGTRFSKKLYKLTTSSAIPVSFAIALLGTMKHAVAAPLILHSPETVAMLAPVYSDPQVTHMTLKTANIGVKMMPLIKVVQDLGLPVGITVALWGLIETMIGNAKGRDKIKTSIVCFCGMYLIPMVFFAIHDALKDT